MGPSITTLEYFMQAPLLFLNMFQTSMLFHLYLPEMLKISNERTANGDLIANLLLISFYSFLNYLNALFNNVLLLANSTRSDLP